MARLVGCYRSAVVSTYRQWSKIYHGVDGRRNGVGVILKEDYVKRVLEVRRVSD